MTEPDPVDVTTRVIPLLAYLANGAADILTAPVGRVVVAPGTAEAWDDCCDGQVHVRLSSITPRYSGRPGVDKACTFLDWELTIALGVTRCAHTVDDNGVAPSPDLISQDAFDASQDMFELSKFIACFQLPYAHFVAFGNWQPLGVLGGCHGGQWTFTLRLSGLGPVKP